jgi:hypothetical protein
VVQDNEQLRAEAVEATLERNPAAFRPKIATGYVDAGSRCQRLQNERLWFVVQSDTTRLHRRATPQRL